jgi:transcriptional regulator with XRE-family HTH domain
VSFKVSKPNSLYPAQLSSLGDHLRKRRLDIGLLQSEVAAHIGVTADCVGDWETGRNTPDAPLVPSIMDFLGYCPYEPPKAFGHWLKMAREGVGLSQAALERDLGIAKGNVSQWERGETRPFRRSLIRLRKFFGEPDGPLPEWLTESASFRSRMQAGPGQ